VKRERWRLIWTGWFLGMVVIVSTSFGVLEFLSWESGQTLSHVTSELPKPLVFVLGFVDGGLTGALATHFWWHWSGR